MKLTPLDRPWTVLHYVYLNSNCIKFDWIIFRIKKLYFLKNFAWLDVTFAIEYIGYIKIIIEIKNSMKLFDDISMWLHLKELN